MIKSGHLFAAAVLLSTVAPLQAEEPDAATVVARVNGTEISLGQMIAAREALPEQYKSLPDDVLFKGVLDQIIQQTALAQEAEKNKKLRDQLMIENQRRSYLAGTVLQSVAEAAVTDEGLKRLYDETYAKAEPKKEYDAAHILVKTEQEAQSIKAELDKGADFAALAAEKSTDRGSATNGGGLGWFGLGSMVKPFEDAVVGLDKGAVSAPVETEFGWHIIKLNDIRTAEAPPFDDVKAELSGQLQEKAVEAKVTSLLEATKIEKQVDGIDPAILKRTDLLDQ